MLHDPGAGHGDFGPQTVSVIVIERNYFAELEPVPPAQSFF
jgi:hypothetical protein